MGNNKTRVLVTGAGGHIGRELVKILSRRHNQLDISVFDLNTPANREFFDRYDGKITMHYGDITDASSLIGITSNLDVVVHLSAITPPVAHEAPELAENVNVTGTTNLVNALETNSPDAFFIMTSSVAVYGDRFLNPYIKVNDPLNPSEGDTYAENKIAMEKIIQNSSLKWSIFRLSAILGIANHISPEMMFKIPLEQIMEVCTPRDTARALLNSIYHIDELSNKIFNLGGGVSCTTTYGELLKNNFEIYGLGTLDFPQKAFATKNFHCGFYEDGDILNDILDFRRDTLEDYYKALKANIPTLQKLATRSVARLVKSYLLSKSEPYAAWLNDDSELKRHYFR